MKSVDEALVYAYTRVGAKKAAELIRAAVFSDKVGDTSRLGSQLASALIRAVDRHVASGAGARQDWPQAVTTR